MDKRVLKTRNLLKSVLYTELKTRPIQKLTVTEICDKAMIGKSTFYLHYSDLYELYNEFENEFFDRWQAHFSDMDFLSYLDNPYPLIKNVVDYVNSESEFFAIAKQSNLEHSLQYRLSDLIKRTLIKTLNLDPSSQSYNIAINFLMYGTAGIVYDNLNSKNLETAIQIACAIISVLVKSIMPDV